MPSPRIVLLSILDGQGRFGLGPESVAAARAGADVVPIATGIAERGEDTVGIRPVRPRLVATALREALELPVDGMMIGLIPDYWQARAVHRLLIENLPETLVWAPLSRAFDAASFLGTYNRRLQLTQIVPEATVAVLPEDQAGALIGQPGADRTASAAALVGSGAHAAWVRGIRDDGRGVDSLHVGNRSSTFDYPDPDASAPPIAAAILAALLAEGRELNEAIETAGRRDARLGDAVHVAARA